MRGKQAHNRVPAPDYKYNNLVISKLINYLMQDGKKTTAEKIVYKALDKLAKDTKMQPVEAFELAISNIKPKVEVRSRRVGGANYQVPVPVSERRQLTLALRWIVDAVRSNRGGRESYEVLAGELALATKKEGSSVKKRDDAHKMAEANKAFSHLGW